MVAREILKTCRHWHDVHQICSNLTTTMMMMEHDDNDVLKFSFCFIVSNSVSGFLLQECCILTIQSVVYIPYRVLYGNWCLSACPPVSLLSSWLISCPYDPPHPFPQPSLEIDLSGWPTFQPNIELFSLPNLLCLSLPCQLGCSTLIKSYSTTVPHACLIIFRVDNTLCACASQKDELKQLSLTTTVIKSTPLLLDHCLVSPEAPQSTLDVFFHKLECLHFLWHVCSIRSSLGKHACKSCNKHNNSTAAIIIWCPESGRALSSSMFVLGFAMLNLVDFS